MWRASVSFALRLARTLADGTYLAELRPARKSGGPPVTVRVIECTVHTAAAGKDSAAESSSEVFCLVTDLLDVEEYPALELACAYPLRWGCETVTGCHKTDMGEGQPVLRSKDPEGAAQEMWALFAVYQAICQLIGAGVDAAGIPPGRISFPHALAAVTDTITAAFPPDQLDLALATFLLKILDPRFLVRDRPCRASPRKTRKAGDWPHRSLHARSRAAETSTRAGRSRPLPRPETGSRRWPDQRISLGRMTQTRFSARRGLVARDCGSRPCR